MENSLVATADGSVFCWGTNKHDELALCSDDIATPNAKKIPNMVFKIPQKLDWAKLMRWIFLGRTDHDSIFFVVPVEVVFHLVDMFYQY
jgi:hypothetical protein